MTEWLSFWNAATRRLREEKLNGYPVGGIYVPFGKGEVQRGDTIYCVAIENGELRLLTRVMVAVLLDDPDHAESVLVDCEDDKEVPVTDYNRVVTVGVLATIRFAHISGTEHGMVVDGEEGAHIDGHRFQGRSSLRRLVAGAAELDALLEDDANRDTTPASQAITAVQALADDYENALDLLEEFCGRFYWIKDHPDYQAQVRKFLTVRGRDPHGIG